MLIQSSLLQHIKECLAGSWRDPCCRCKPADTLQLAVGVKPLAGPWPALMPPPLGSSTCLAALPTPRHCSLGSSSSPARLQQIRQLLSRSTCAGATWLQLAPGSAEPHMRWRAVMDACQGMALLMNGSVQCRTCTTASLLERVWAG